MSDALDLLNSKVDRLEGTVDAVVVELGELKAALDAAVASNDTAGIEAASQRLGDLADKLAAAGNANDPTPETPVP